MFNIDFNLSPNKLKLELLKLHESDIADLFEENKIYREKIYLVLGVKSFKNVFVLLSEDVQVEFFDSLNTDQKRSLLKFLDTDDIKTLIDLYDRKNQLNIILLLQEKTKNEITKLLSYEVGSSGSLSSPHFISLDINTNIKDATKYVITESKEKDQIDVIFFYNESKVFVGALTLQELIIARANQKISNLINENYPFVYDNEPVTEAIKKIRDYDIEAIPVLDLEGQIVGIIPLEDALILMDEMHIETIGQLYKVHDLKQTDSPLKRSYVRLPWLLISAALNLVIVSFLSIFQGTLESNIALILFQPMILAMAGNIGTQSISVTILRFQKEANIHKNHILKEIGIGLINGLLSGILGILIVYVFLYLLPNNYVDMHLVALTVGLSLFLAMFVSSLCGVFIPVILRRFGFDEKAASGPLITTINDFFALGIYFLIATLILLV
ncbi:magnesium transporter [Acholeplasma granularum]|uniref:magnesium transporter n=1 Tax=Acholeplasma granularum TaxID=264635 RepID=UPI00046F4B5C|nr:magnesium transporter [Acholeplasma granularum]